MVKFLDLLFGYKPQPKRIKQGKYIRGEDRWIQEATKQFNSIRRTKNL